MSDCRRELSTPREDARRFEVWFWVGAQRGNKMGKVTENGYIVMTEVLSTMQELHRKLSTGRDGMEWSRALAKVHTCKVVCGHQGLRAVSAAMSQIESVLNLQYSDEHLDDVLRTLDDAIGELRPRVHGAPTIPSDPERAALS